MEARPLRINLLPIRDLSLAANENQLHLFERKILFEQSPKSVVRGRKSIRLFVVSFDHNGNKRRLHMVADIVIDGNASTLIRSR